MKILYILSSSGEFGGASKSFVNLLKAMRDFGCITKIMIPDSNGLYKTLMEEGFDVVVSGKIRFDTPPQSNNKLDLVLYYPRILKRELINLKAYKIIKREALLFKPDIIHTNVSPVTIGWYLAKSLKIPHIMHVREYGDLDFNLKINNINKILSKPYTISITKDIARHRNILDSIGHTVIYNGIYSKNKIKFNPFKKPFFLYAGRLTKGKGIDSLINSYILYTQRVENPYELIILGNAPDPASKNLVNELKEKLDSLNLREYVKWKGAIKNCDDYMNEAAATIVPSYFEGFGRVMAEAMFNGCLVVGRNTGGTKEQFDNGIDIEHNEIGLRFNTDAECANHLYDISVKGIDYTPMILKSQEVVKALYTIESNSKKTFEFYKQILKDRCNDK